MEAQCALLFDKLNWEWEYEPYSFMLPSGINFMPDFWLPDEATFVECRGYENNKGDKQINDFRKVITVGDGVWLSKHDESASCFWTFGPREVTRYHVGYIPYDDQEAIRCGTTVDAQVLTGMPCDGALLIFCAGCFRWRLFGPFDIYCWGCNGHDFRATFSLCVDEGKLFVDDRLAEEWRFNG
jgi:hypothetical protein